MIPSHKYYAPQSLDRLVPVHVLKVVSQTKDFPPNLSIRLQPNRMHKMLLVYLVIVLELLWRQRTHLAVALEVVPATYFSSPQTIIIINVVSPGFQKLPPVLGHVHWVNVANLKSRSA